MANLRASNTFSLSLYVDRVRSSLTKRFLRSASDQQIIVENAQRERRRGEDPVSARIVPSYIPIRKVSLREWTQAVDLAMSPHTQYDRRDLYRIYWNVMLDLHLSSIIDKRVMRAQSVQFNLIDAEGEIDRGAARMLAGIWYDKYIQEAILSKFYGHSLIELWEMSEDEIPVETNAGRRTYCPIKVATLIRREHVKPERGEWLNQDWQQEGVSYEDEPYNTYYLPVGERFDLGLLMKIAPVALAKRYTQGHWADFNEKMGIPFRWVNQRGTNKKRQKLLGEIMAKMGAAGWAVLNADEEVNMLQQGNSDPYKVFQELLMYCDRAMSKIVLGQTLTTDDGQRGTFAQGIIHQGEGEIIHRADAQFIEYINNTELIPRLIKMGYPLEGYIYEIDDKRELTIEEQVNIFTLLLTHYKVDPAYIADQFDMPEEMIANKEQQEVEEVLTEAMMKAKAVPKKKILTVHHDCDSYKAHYLEQVATVQSKITPEDEAYLRAFYDDENARGFAFDYFKQTHLELLKSINDGWPVEEMNIEYDQPDHLTRSMFRMNVHRFGYEKTAWQVLELNRLAADAQSWRDFRDAAGATITILNENYLRTEFETAQAIAQGTARQLEHMRDAETFPYWEYRATLDERTREDHRSLHGLIFRTGDAEAEKLNPPLGFNCRCIRRRRRSVDAEEITTFDQAMQGIEPKERERIEKAGFLVNRADTKELFTDTQYYLSDLPQDVDNPFTLEAMSTYSFADQGLKAWAETNYTHPALTQTAAYEMLDQFDEIKDAGNRVELKDWENAPMWIDQQAVEAMRDRPIALDDLVELINHPDEVYFLFDEEQHTYKYIKAFEDAVVVGFVELSIERHQLYGWQILTDLENIDSMRQGLLIYNE